MVRLRVHFHRPSGALVTRPSADDHPCYCTDAREGRQTRSRLRNTTQLVNKKSKKRKKKKKRRKIESEQREKKTKGRVRRALKTRCPSLRPLGSSRCTVRWAPRLNLYLAPVDSRPVPETDEPPPVPSLTMTETNNAPPPRDNVFISKNNFHFNSNNGRDSVCSQMRG